MQRTVVQCTALHCTALHCHATHAHGDAHVIAKTGPFLCTVKPWKQPRHLQNSAKLNNHLHNGPAPFDRNPQRQNFAIQPEFVPANPRSGVLAMQQQERGGGGCRGFRRSRRANTSAELLRVSGKIFFGVLRRPAQSGFASGGVHSIRKLKCAAKVMLPLVAFSAPHHHPPPPLW